MAIDPNWVRENPEEAARQIELLTKERDQYRAAEEKQIAMRKKVDYSEEALAAHVERLVVAANDAINQPRSCMMVARWERTLKDAPANSLASRDVAKRAEGAVDFVAWLEKECEANGEVGEMFGMSLSGITGDSRAAPNLRAARVIFAEAKKIAEWKLEQSVAVKS